MRVDNVSDVEREILRPLWKIHILHHADEAPIVGHGMLEELREHGYRVSPGTLYPMLARMERLGWLAPIGPARENPAKKAGRPLRLTAPGKAALREVRARLQELEDEVFAT